MRNNARGFVVFSCALTSAHKFNRVHIFNIKRFLQYRCYTIHVPCSTTCNKINLVSAFLVHFDQISSDLFWNGIFITTCINFIPEILVFQIVLFTWRIFLLTIIETRAGEKYGIINIKADINWAFAF